MVLQLLQCLEKQQKNSLSKGYLDGIFASQRFHPIVPYVREDENIFFSTAIAFTLQEYLHVFAKEEEQMAKAIVQKIVGCYTSFKNFKGGKTYNYFKTKPMDFFPNGKIMRHYRLFKLADDADDTVYVYLTDKKQNHTWLKEKLIKHANGTLKWNLHKKSAYSELKTYNVYFGKNMHIETDACVLCNILLWSYRYSQNKTKQDKDSVTYLLRAIVSKDYIKSPYLVSPCYPTTHQICYHISRLIKQPFKNSKLAVLRPLLIDDIRTLLNGKLSLIEELFYHISLLNLGIRPSTKLHHPLESYLKSTDYFYTSIPLMIPKLWARKLQKFKLFQFFGLRTQCDGYTTMLLLEYHILYQNQRLNQ